MTVSRRSAAACAPASSPPAQRHGFAVQAPGEDAVFGVRFTDRRPLRTWMDLTTADKDLGIPLGARAPEARLAREPEREVLHLDHAQRRRRRADAGHRRRGVRGAEDLARSLSLMAGVSCRSSRPAAVSRRCARRCCRRCLLAARRAFCAAQDFPRYGDALYEPRLRQPGKDVMWLPTPERAMVTRHAAGGQDHRPRPGLRPGRRRRPHPDRRGEASRRDRRRHRIRCRAGGTGQAQRRARGRRGQGHHRPGRHLQARISRRRPSSRCTCCRISTSSCGPSCSR